MDKQQLLNAQVWEDAWRDDPSTFANRMKRTGFDPYEAFAPKAVEFDRTAFSEEGVKRRERIMGWLEDQGMAWEGSSVLDVGAASGGFSIPFAERGAIVTAVEPCAPLGDLMQAHAAGLTAGSVTLVRETFEALDPAALGWHNRFDLVFASMCPAVTDWQSVESLIRCARRYVYISLSAGPHENSLLEEILPLVTDRIPSHGHSEMVYLLQLLYLRGYSYASLVTREMKTVECSVEDAAEEMLAQLRMRKLPAEEDTRRVVTDYLNRTYPGGAVRYQQGGRFGKVLIQLGDLRMYSKKG
ncbi:class I SAM-dependent methyltransferase [Gorillibacterium sp. sgz5001074]|uniref:class I SAM-dependent methyltransferase n=1 Tax=Gorillibacterium sp. sgz5001074 TaxID=3446695 RepID=UPI003F680734